MSGRGLTDEERVWLHEHAGSWDIGAMGDALWIVKRVWELRRPCRYCEMRPAGFPCPDHEEVKS